ncbi:MAG: hypothetical protein WDW36_009089 [Sanguina aurantia]
MQGIGISGGSGSAAAHASQPQPEPRSPAAAPCEAVRMSATRVVMQQLVMPSDCDAMSICKGGQVLSWIDLCAGLSAKMLARGPCVTASVDTVHFLRPCRLGMVVIISAMVHRTFDSSMEVGVRVETEEMRTGQRHHSCSAHLTFVACGQSRAGAKAKLPRIQATTPEHITIYDSALDRRQERLQQRSSVQADRLVAAAQDVCRLRPVTHRVGGLTVPPAPLLLLLAPGRAPAPSAAPPPANSGTGPHTEQQHPQHQCQHPPANGTTTDGVQQPTHDLSAERTEHDTALQQQQEQQQQQQQQQQGKEQQQEEKQQSQQQQQQQGKEPASAETGGGDPGFVTPMLSSLPVPPPRQSVSPGMTIAYMTQSILPSHANTLSITFGGQVMRWMEECSYIAASRLRGHDHALTACLDSVAFVRPTRVGDIMYITAQVSATFGSSLEVMISVHGEDPAVGEVFHCADAFLTLVTVDARGSPVLVPCDLMPGSQAEHLRLKGAIVRRAARLQLRKGFEASEMDGAGTLPIDLALM